MRSFLKRRTPLTFRSDQYNREAPVFAATSDVSSDTYSLSRVEYEMSFFQPQLRLCYWCRRGTGCMFSMFCESARITCAAVYSFGRVQRLLESDTDYCGNR